MPASRFDILDTDGGRLIVRIVAIATLTGALAAAAVVVVTSTGRVVPVPLASAALIVPVLAAGQLLMMAIVTRRLALDPMPRFRHSPRSAIGEFRRRLFGDLPAVAIGTTAVLFYGSIILMGVSMASGTAGQPVRNGGGCSYGAANGGEVACLSRTEYDSASAAWQRAFAAGLLAFFSVQTAVVGSEVRARRASDS